MTFAKRVTGPSVPLFVVFAGLVLFFAPIASGAERDDGHISGSLTLGVGAAPDYEGSDDYAPIPLIAAEMRLHGYVLRTDGIGLRADLVRNDRFSAGPIMRYARGRGGVSDSRVDRLRDVDGGLEAGAFAGLRHPGLLTRHDAATVEVSAVQEVAGGHCGALVTLSLGWSAPLSDRLRFATGVSTTYATGPYMRSFFGIDADNAARSGLRRFSAGSGLKDAGLALTLSRAVAPAWSVNGTLGYSRLMGDATDSPVTRDRGSADQVFLGLGLTRRF